MVSVANQYLVLTLSDRENFLYSTEFRELSLQDGEEDVFR